ncbi:hypothetical protein OF83DRAFT_590276 [Amylostereum chailletii]|nr:hypothetical protein OF83DRAFT_590276 [Amylostereum chailletii]
MYKPPSLGPASGTEGSQTADIASIFPKCTTNEHTGESRLPTHLETLFTPWIILSRTCPSPTNPLPLRGYQFVGLPLNLPFRLSRTNPAYRTSHTVVTPSSPVAQQDGNPAPPHIFHLPLPTPPTCSWSRTLGIMKSRGPRTRPRHRSSSSTSRGFELGPGPKRRKGV